MRIGLENARMIGYVLALSAIVFASIPYYLHVGGIRIGMLIWQAPTLLNVITLNGVLQSGDDYRAQKRLRIAMLTGLFGFVASVTMI
jgi:4-hydroxybenzoate polyprenyltransferase